MDLILGEAEIAIEIKSTKHADTRTKGLHLFHEEYKSKQSLIVSKDPHPRKLTSNIRILPWQYFCDLLWDGEII